MARALLAGLALAGASYLPQVPHRPGRERAAVIAPGGPVAPPAAAACQWRGRRPLVVAMQMEPFQQQQGGGAFGSEDISISSGAAFIVGLDIKRDKYKTLAGDVDQDALWSIDDSLDELQRLCDTAGLQVLGRDYQALQNPSPSTFVGSGKVAELGEPLHARRAFAFGRVLCLGVFCFPAAGRGAAVKPARPGWRRDRPRYTPRPTASRSDARIAPTPPARMAPQRYCRSCGWSTHPLPTQSLPLPPHVGTPLHGLPTPRLYCGGHPSPTPPRTFL